MGIIPCPICMYLSEARGYDSPYIPVCAALRLGLCIIQPLRGCTSYSVSAIQSNISYSVELCRYCSFTRSKHPAVVSRRDTIMHNPRLRESSDRSLGLKSISYCASERYIYEGHENLGTHSLVGRIHIPYSFIPTCFLLSPYIIYVWQLATGHKTARGGTTTG